MLGSADPGVVAFIKSYNDIKSLTDKYKRKKHHRPFYIPFLELTLIFLMKFSSSLQGLPFWCYRRCLCIKESTKDGAIDINLITLCPLLFDRCIYFAQCRATV